MATTVDTTTPTKPTSPRPNMARTTILVGAIALAAVATGNLVGQAIRNSPSPTNHQFLDPVEREFIAGAADSGPVSVSSWFLDPVEREFIAGAADSGRRPVPVP